MPKRLRSNIRSVTRSHVTAAKMVSATLAPNGQAVWNAARSDGLSWDRELLPLELQEFLVALNFDFASRASRPRKATC